MEETYMEETKKYLIPFANKNGGDVEDYYVLEGEAGRVAFSVVVVACHKKTNLKVAIKMIDKKNTDDDEMFNEVSIHCQLSHPNIITFREIFDGPKSYFVVLDLATGGELFDRIIEIQRFPEKEALHVMLQVLSGVKYMHDLHIVHRNLKPEDLVLSSRDKNPDIKIIDFGFATKLTNDFELLQLVGTPPYFAPEVSLLRDETVMDGYGRPVDIWAMGVILYILLSGIHPFLIRDEELMLDNIQNVKWNFVGPNWSKISSEAKDLIKHMMEKDARKRFTVDQCLEHRWMKGPVQ